MFNLGPLELMVVFGLALVVLGPRRLPEVARHLGKFYGMIRKTTWELRQTLDAEILEEERGQRREAAELRREEFRAKRAAEREAAGPPPSADSPKPAVAPPEPADESPPADTSPPPTDDPPAEASS